jgi:transposase
MKQRQKYPSDLTDQEWEKLKSVLPPKSKTPPRVEERDMGCDIFTQWMFMANAST